MNTIGQPRRRNRSNKKIIHSVALRMPAFDVNHNDNNNNNNYINYNSKYDINKNNQGLKESSKIDNRSKFVKKGKSKTPAQDRLQNFADKKKSTAIVQSLHEIVNLKLVNLAPNNKLSSGIISKGPNLNFGWKKTNEQNVIDFNWNSLQSIKKESIWSEVASQNKKVVSSKLDSLGTNNKLTPGIIDAKEENVRLEKANEWNVALNVHQAIQNKSVGNGIGGQNTKITSLKVADSVSNNKSLPGIINENEQKLKSNEKNVVEQNVNPFVQAIEWDRKECADQNTNKNQFTFKPTFHFGAMESVQPNCSLHTNKKGYHANVPNRFKLNDKSKQIGVKKTPAQDRFQKFTDENKASMLASLNELVDMEFAVAGPNNQRKSFGIQKSHVTGKDQSITDVISKSGSMNNMMDAAYIIPDTNVFLNSLACIKSVIEKGEDYTLLVPFVVFQELDRLKNRRGEQNFSVKLNARRAIQYIYELLKTNNTHFKGQTTNDDMNRLVDVNSNDDRILNCCLQLTNQSKEVILVTNDLNLANIARINRIETITLKRCLEKFQ